MWQPTEKMQKWRKLAEYWSRPTKCPAALILAVIQHVTIVVDHVVVLAKAVLIVINFLFPCLN